MNDALAIQIKLSGKKSIGQINNILKLTAEEFLSTIGNVYRIRNSDIYIIPIIVPHDTRADLLVAVRDLENDYGFILENENVYL